MKTLKTYLKTYQVTSQSLNTTGSTIFDKNLKTYQVTSQCYQLL